MPGAVPSAQMRWERRHTPGTRSRLLSAWRVDVLSIKRMNYFLSAANTDIYMGSLCKHRQGLLETLRNLNLLSPCVPSWTVLSHRPISSAGLEHREGESRNSPMAALIHRSSGPSQAY